MEFKERREKFLARFGISYSVSQEEAMQFLKKGVKNSLEGIDDKLPEEQIRKYCNQFGYSTIFRNGPGGRYSDENVFKCITEEKNFHRYLFKLESLFYCNFDRASSKHPLYIEINNIFINSNLDLLFVKSNNDYVIMPSGSAFLDEEIIIKTLRFLNDSAHQHFVNALKLYSQKNSEAYIKSADSVRRALEEYLRYIFKNTKGLDGNIKILEQKLKEIGKQNEIKSIFHKFFDILDKFFNENTKHNDGNVGEAECEFIILQAGLLLKYLDKIQTTLK